MSWSDILALPGYGVMLYVMCAALAELAKAVGRELEKAWLNLVFHGNLTGEKRLKK